MPAGNRDGEQTFCDHYYNHPGVAITASSGDQGYGTVWPAASPFVTSAGGPQLVHDITEGSNFTPSSVCGYLCTAEPGYDGPTGLGTPNGIGGF